MNQMKALGLLSQTYDSTEDFVDELTKHLKVTKVCKENLENCWPTKTVTDASGAEFDVSTVITSENINKKEFDSNSVGLVLADGAHIILAYNKSATPILETEATRPEGNTTNSTQSLAFVMDVNGGRGPNTENSSNDIRGFHGAKFAKGYTCTGTEYDFGGTKVCYLNTNYSYIDCTSSNSSSPDYKTYCGNGSSYTNDYWAGAKKACAEMGLELPDQTKLKSIYDEYAKIKGNGSAPSLSGWFWSSFESGSNNNSAYDVYFDNGHTGDNFKSYHYQVFCSGS